MASIFISHSHYDAELAKIFINFLESGLDISKDGIYCHSLEAYATDIGNNNYVNHIVKNLKNKKILLIVLTQEYLDSHFCTFEFGIAQAFNHSSRRKIQIIPVTVPQLLTKPEKIHDFLRLVHKCDISKSCSMLKELVVKSCSKSYSEENFSVQVIKFNEEACTIIDRRKKEQKGDFNYIMANSPLLPDINEVVKLINENRARPTPNLAFFGEAKLEREDPNCLESRYVLPLTDLTLDFFTRDDKARNWFEEERALNHIFVKKRVVIIDSATIDNGDAYNFLISYEDLDWRIIVRDNLIKDEEKCMFRDFCIFDFNNQQKSSAYFTYLDYKHENLFIKGSWSQYHTSDCNYIKKLRDHFDYLWDFSEDKPIKKYIEILKSIKK